MSDSASTYCWKPALVSILTAESSGYSSSALLDACIRGRKSEEDKMARKEGQLRDLVFDPIRKHGRGRLRTR
jgi:hypothetical protein